MEPLAIACVTAGVWVMYCGVYGIPPIDTAAQIIREPASARQIIDDAKSATAQRLKDLGIAIASTAGTPGIGTGGGNPFGQFKVNSSYADHVARGSKGIDYNTPVGTPLPSAISGRVTVSPNAGNYGHKVTVRGANGVVSTYAHLSKIMVKDGQEVKAGDILGLSGGAKGAEGAGNSTGPHVHWELFVNGVSTDPSTYFAKAG